MTGHVFAMDAMTAVTLVMNMTVMDETAIAVLMGDDEVTVVFLSMKG